MIDLGKAFATENGGTFRLFCSFQCPEEAVGEITVPHNETTVDLPICQKHLDELFHPDCCPELDTIE